MPTHHTEMMVDEIATLGTMESTQDAPKTRAVDATYREVGVTKKLASCLTSALLDMHDKASQHDKSRTT